MLPAGVANTVPVIAAKYSWLPALNRPLDGGATFRGRRVLGDHKTWRGLLVGIVFGSITGIILGQSAVVGGLLGFGALAGDAAKSFFKRQLNIAPGKPWPLFDQLDYVLGALLVASFMFPLTTAHVISAVIMFSFASYATSYLGMKLKIKKSL